MHEASIVRSVIDIAESEARKHGGSNIRKIKIDENSIPVREDVRGACEILGFDPLYLANEGRFVAFIAASDADRALDILRSHPLGEGSCLIGKVTNDSSPAVVMRSRIGATRIVDMFSGEQLPRIC